MSEYLNETEEDELYDELAPNSDLPSFDIGLNPGGDAGSSFRTQNDPSSPYQRENYVERQGAVDIRCSCLDVVHGLFDADGSAFATLIVLQFRFDVRKRARRFESVDISLEFRGMKPGDVGPEVYKISPDGNMAIVPTTEHEDVTRNANLQLGGAGPIGGLTATGTVGWEKTVSRDTTDQTTIVGNIALKGRNWGKSNTARWTLLENKTAKTGVPTAMRTAILLKRKDEDQFQCVVNIRANVDFRSSLEQVFGGKGSKPKDDPVLFNPMLEPTHNMQKYDIKELGAFHLESICDVTFSTILDGVVKNKTQVGSNA